MVSLFHEFGHALHFLFSGNQRWGRNEPLKMEWDFVEVPSLFLDQWARAPESLRTFARHHETGESLSAEVLERMERANAAGRGLWMLRWTWWSLMALRYHTRNPSDLDTTEFARELQTRYDLIPWFERTHFQCVLPHLASYASRFYTYAWSLAIVRDLLIPFAEEGSMLDPAFGMNFRQLVLEPGASRPAAELVKTFLDRNWDFDAFGKWVNVPPSLSGSS